MRRKYVRLAAAMLVGTLTLGTATTGVCASTTIGGVTGAMANILASSTTPTAGATGALAKVLSVNTKTAAVQENDTTTVTSEYADIAIAKVNDYVYVRKEADADSDYVGKLYSNNAATVTEELDGWYKIESGSVTGYVSADYVVVGDEDAVKAASRRVATVNTETLRVREKAKKSSDVITLVPGGDDLTVVNEDNEEWIQVTTEAGNGYVSADFVSLSTEFEYAESKDEEENRLAREAAEAAAAAAAAAAATSSSSSSSSGSSKSSKTYSKPSGSNGQAVANYACQFVGNPYRYGGSSLTNGADCSGFVMSVYKAFGISLPHSSSSLRGVGSKVSVDNMQAGDIVCYSGHVAIYIGGGQIVHASNRKTGIKISNVSYRHIICVRRIF